MVLSGRFVAFRGGTERKERGTGREGDVDYDVSK